MTDAHLIRVQLVKFLEFSPETPHLFLQLSCDMICACPGGVLGSIFAGYVPLASPVPYPIIVYSVVNYRPHVSHFWANITQIPTCRNLLTPEIRQMCDPILVTLLAPNENATPL